MTHVCVSKLGHYCFKQCRDAYLAAIYYMDQCWLGILSIQTLKTHFGTFWIKIHVFSYKKMVLERSPAKWRPFCSFRNALNRNLSTDTGIFGGIYIQNLIKFSENVLKHQWSTYSTTNGQFTRLHTIYLCSKYTRHKVVGTRKRFSASLAFLGFISLKYNTPS